VKREVLARSCVCSGVRVSEEMVPIDETAPVPADHVASPDFESVVRREYPGLIATSRLLVGSTHTAEEVVQDCLTRAYRRWDSVGEMDLPGAWLRRIVINASLSTLRRRRAEMRAIRQMGGQRRDSPSEPELDRFAALVSGLPAQMSRAVALRYGADLTVKQVAAEMAVSESAAQSVLFRARERLRSSIDPSGGRSPEPAESEYEEESR